MSQVQIRKPDRQSARFSEEMTDDVVDALLCRHLFAAGSEASIDPERFRNVDQLKEILKHDSRVRHCSPGEIIIRQGDWGNTAFFLLSGSVRVDIGRTLTIPENLLGRQTSVRKKNFWRAFAQLWNRNPIVEFRNLAKYQNGQATATQGRGVDTRVILQDFQSIIDRFETTRIEALEVFGEQSALGRMERTATVFADQDCELLEIRWQGLRDIMRAVPWVRKLIDERFREYGLRAFLRKSPYFSHLDYSSDEAATDAERTRQKRAKALESKLLTHAEFASYGVYDRSEINRETPIAREGEYPNGVILIRSGVARVSRSINGVRKTVGYLTPGHAFAIDEILEGWRTGEAVPYRYSLSSLGTVSTVVIPTSVFEDVVLEELQKRDGLIVKEPTSRKHASHEEPARSGLVEFLVEGRYVNGSATMVIDLDRCTRCDDCVRACAAAHDGNPRFLRHGPTFENYMIANACMHCADPVCMIQCPTGAIHRNMTDGNVIINDLTCIGCSSCANNCPYDAIRMVPIRDQDSLPVIPTHELSKTTQNDLVEIGPKSVEPITKATKCDLCSDQITGPACQQACPHDALVRLDLQSFETAEEWLRSG